MVLRAIGQTFVAQPVGAAIALTAGRITTDEQGRTSHPKVWAGGDCRVGGRDLQVAQDWDLRRSGPDERAAPLASVSILIQMPNAVQAD